MQENRDLFNKKVAEIEISGIRRFDAAVSHIPNLIKLTIGEPDFNTPEHIKSAAIRAIEKNYSHYSPNAGYPELQTAAANYMKRHYQLDYTPESDVIITVGASEAIAASFCALLNPGDAILIPTPSYPSYKSLANINRANVLDVDVSQSNFLLTADLLSKTIVQHPEIKILMLNYPTNPTGVSYTPKELDDLVAIIKKHNLIVISDEIYSELNYTSEKHLPIAKLLPDQTILLHGLSKSHAMTGWRIGFIFAPKKYVDQIKKVHQYFVTGATSISQIAAIEALDNGDQDTIDMCNAFLERRNFVTKTLEELGLRTPRADGAFYLFPKIPAHYGQDDEKFCYDLAEHAKVATVPGSAFGSGGRGHFRISYATDIDTLKRAMTQMKNFIEKL